MVLIKANRRSIESHLVYLRNFAKPNGADFAVVFESIFLTPRPNEKMIVVLSTETTQFGTDNCQYLCQATFD